MKNANIGGGGKEFTRGGGKKIFAQKVPAPGLKKILCTPLHALFVFNKVWSLAVRPECAQFITAGHDRYSLQLVMTGIHQDWSLHGKSTTID